MARIQDSDEDGVPELLKLVVSKAAYCIAQGFRSQLIGDGSTLDFRALVSLYRAEVSSLLRETVEVYSSYQYTLRLINPDVLLRHNFPAETVLFLFVRCRYGRPDDTTLQNLAADEYVYVCTAPAGQSQGVIVQRLT